MKLQVIQAQDCAPQAWRNGGGQTRELLVWPPWGDWQLRISRADIKADGPFSAFPGVQRWFAVLEGAGVALQLGCEQKLRMGDMPLRFDGEAAPACRLLDGPTQDLNLMTRQGRGFMQAVRAKHAWTATFSACGLYTCHAGIWTDGTQRLALAAHTLLWQQAPRGATWEFHPDDATTAATAYWLGFSPASPTIGDYA